MSSQNDDFTSNVVSLVGDGIRSERKAGAVIKPGWLVELNSSDKVVPHSTAGGKTGNVANIDRLQGNGLADDYAVDDLVQYDAYSEGNVFNGLLADGETIVIGDPLTSNGDGYVKKATGTDKIVGYSLKAVDMSGSSAADPDGRIPVEVAQ